MLAPEPRHGAMTMSSTQQSCATVPDGKRGLKQTWLPGSAKSPPGPAKVIADWPKFVYDAGRSRLVAPRPQPSGAVADTEITPTDCAGTNTVLAVWSISVALLPAAAITVTPCWFAYDVARLSAMSRCAMPLPRPSICAPRLMLMM